MKRLLTLAALTLGATVLLGLGVNARAGEPPAAPLPIGPGIAAPVVTAPGAPVVKAPDAPVSAPAPAVVIESAGCAPACDTTCLKKVCVPGTDIKTTTKRVYGDVCEDFCMPRCSLPKLSLGLFKHDDCGACPSGCPEEGSCAGCEHRIYQKKFLVVHVKKCEEVVNKCHVELQPVEPSCRTPLFGHRNAEPAACLPETVIIQSPAPAVKMPQATDNTKPK
jgi:hypothetical protein